MSVALAFENWLGQPEWSQTGNARTMGALLGVSSHRIPRILPVFTVNGYPQADAHGAIYRLTLSSRADLFALVKAVPPEARKPLARKLAAWWGAARDRAHALALLPVPKRCSRRPIHQAFAEAVKEDPTPAPVLFALRLCSGGSAAPEAIRAARELARAEAADPSALRAALEVSESGAAVLLAPESPEVLARQLRICRGNPQGFWNIRRPR